MASPIPGSKKTVGSGRKKGTPNKKSSELILKAQELGIDPFEVLLRFAKGDWEGLGYESKTRTMYTKSGEPYYLDIITADHRLKAASEACQYLHPKRKSIDVLHEQQDPDSERPYKDLSDEELDKL